MPRAATPHRTRTRNTKRTPSLLAGAALLASTLTAAALPASAHAATPVGTGKYVALGDSYAAGAGVPGQSAGLCLRSDHNYGRLVAAALAPSSYADKTCAGAKVSALTTRQTDLGIVVNDPQLDAVTPDTSLVTLTLGGNDLGTSDVGFVDVVAACIGLSLTNPFGTPCKNFYGDTLDKRLDSAATRLTDGLRKLSAKAPNAKVMVVGYPAVLPDDPTRCLGKMPATTGDLRFLRSVLGELNTKVAKAATAAGASYVDTFGPTKGHDACSANRWVEGLLPTSPAVPLHPNATGERVMAQAVLKALGR
ncbi:SGNH/GDSL hydrolase family protein [Streptomyces sp. NPDC056149]|uniref:SGNH/GDSL hydrolase family protein n=1 Tax=unclassified Streptomyces TaxID=2593676 RepID=UPI00238181C5|nr:SGNH/GDSL hydrolase family protein [Streptomyces sp. WZ-12]